MEFFTSKDLKNGHIAPALQHPQPSEFRSVGYVPAQTERNGKNVLDLQVGSTKILSAPLMAKNYCGGGAIRLMAGGKDILPADLLACQMGGDRYLLVGILERKQRSDTHGGMPRHFQQH